MSNIIDSNFYIKVTIPKFPNRFQAFSTIGGLTNNYVDFDYFQTKEEAEKAAEFLRKAWPRWPMEVRELDEN